MVPRLIARLALIVPLVAAVAVACEHANPNEPGPVASITVTPTPVTLAQATNQQFTAVVRDAAGNVLSVSPNWSVANGGGTINAGNGLFTSGAVAATYTNTVVASVGSIAASATVTVTSAALATITVTPNPQALAIGQTQQFTAVGKDLNGNVVSITPTWSVVTAASADAVAPITAAGLFKAGTLPGNFANTVKACSTALCAAGSISGFATVVVGAGALNSITVIPNPTTMVTGTSQTFTAVGRDASNNVVIISPAPNWTVVTAASGTIIAGTGAFTAGVTPATYANTIKVTNGVGGTIVGLATVTVTAGPGVLATITVTPNPANLFTGGTQQFTATGYDPSGAVVALPALTWSVDAAVGGGSITSPAALFTAGAVAGTFTNTVKATTGGATPVTGVATVIVTQAVVGPPLGTAATYGITAGSTVSCVAGAINADVSIYPGTALVGFPPCTISGVTHLADAAAAAAQADLLSAYDALALLPCGTTITADLGGTTLAEGVYCSTSSVGVTGTVTLTGNANSLFVIRAASTLTTAGNVVMAGTAQAKNVYWWVGSSATLGTGSQWKGTIVALQSITLAGGVTLTGRALARNGAVALNGAANTITLP